MQLKKKCIIFIRSTVLVALVGAIIGVGVYGCKKEEPQKEDMSAKTSVSLEDKLYRQSKIVFISLRDGNPEIYVMNPDGGEQKNLSDSPAGALVPVWSPDGTKIAFTRNAEIYVMNADGSEQKNLTNNPAHDQYPSWSPDGKKIVFVSLRDGNRRDRNNEIYVMNADGQDIRRLTYSGIGSFVSSFPSWSPNGKRIAFHSYRDRNHEIYVMNADGSEQKRLTNNRPYNDHPFWSPDGKKIAFIAVRDGNAAQLTPDQRREIYVMNADGSEQKNLTNNSAYDAGLSWSPDGKKIAFDSYRDGNLEIYVMNADGNEQKRLTKDPVEDCLPSWSPDGRKIAFRSKRDGNYEIYVMNADGSEQKNLTNNPAHDEAPSWSPFLGSVAKEESQKEDTPPIESIVQEPPPKADGGAKMTVKLLDPGAQPRTALRYKFQANRTEKLVMEMSMAMAMEIGDQKRPETQVPVTRMTMTIDSKEVSPEGDLHYEFELEQVEVLPNPGADPAMANAMKQQMSRMLGLSGSATVTSRGFTKDAEIKLPPGIDPQIRQSMDNIKQSINQMSAPLPEEPVGRDARWQVTMPMETPAMKFTQIATYTLSEIQGDKVKFDITIKQSASPQEIDTPGAAPGVKVSLESLKSSGKGTVELQMTNLVPTSNINMTTTNVVSANNQKIKTTMRIGMKIHPFAEVKDPPAIKSVVPKEKTVASARQGRKDVVELDPQKILSEARADARAKRYEDALSKHVWFHNNALKYRPSLSGVRLSFAISYWKRLAEAYPPALDKLVEIRDQALKNVNDGKNVRNSFQDMAAINRTLGEEQHTKDAFVSLDKRDPAAARIVFTLAQPALIKAKEYELCGKYIDPKAAVAFSIRLFQMNRRFANDADDPQRASRQEEFANKKFANDIATLVALLVVNERKAEAQEVASEAKKEWDDAAFHAALDTALEGRVPDPWP